MHDDHNTFDIYKYIFIFKDLSTLNFFVGNKVNKV